MSENKHALAVLQSGQISTPGGNLKTLADQAVAELAAIRDMETGAALRALRFGLVMYQAKATAKHGQFMSWQKATFKGIAKSQCNYYMRLAFAFVEQTKLDVAGVLALPAAQGELLPAKQSGQARTSLEKALEFIDGRSLNECLADEGIKEGKKGAKKKNAQAAVDPEEEAAAERITVQDRFNEIEGHLRAARQGAADKAVWMSFTKQQHADLKAAAQQTADHLVDLFTKTHGRNAK